MTSLKNSLSPSAYQSLQAEKIQRLKQKANPQEDFAYRLLERLHPKQREIADNAARFRIGVCGRRFGKTRLGGTEASVAAYRGGDVMWIAPTYKATQLGWKEVLRLTRPLGKDGVKILKADMVVQFPSGGEITFRSAHNPENLRGAGLDLAVLDESAFLSDDVLPENVMPMLSDRQGRLLMLGTPYGRNWYYNEWLRGINGEEDYASWQLPTRDNPYFPAGELERQKRILPDLIYRQEYEAEFLAYQGLVYPEFNRGLHTAADVSGKIFKYYVGGIDWGYANPGVILIFGVDGDSRMWLVKEVYERQMRIEEWVSTAQQLQVEYGVQTFYADPSNPSNIELMERANVHITSADNDVMAGIHMVKGRLARRADGTVGLVLSTEAIHTAIEFESYMWLEHGKNGLQDKPRKANDHAMDALRYAVMGVGTGDVWDFTTIVTYAKNRGID